MKNLLIVLVLIFAVMGTSFAQKQKQEQIVVNVDDLTPDQLAKIKARNEMGEITDKIETYGEWAGMGKEVGVAVREGLVAVKDVTVDFADTDLGRITMGLIIWKVIGDDIAGIVFGVPFWLIGSIVLIRFFRKTCLPRKLLISREGGWWIFGGKREYDYRSPQWEGDGGAAFIYLIVMGIWTGVMFGAVIF